MFNNIIMRRITYFVNESSFGASTSLELSISDANTVLFASDTSTHNTNWAWDYWSFDPHSLIGMELEEAHNMIMNNFSSFEDDFRKPYVSYTPN